MLRLGIMGTNWITDSFIEGAENSGKWTLTAVYSRTLEKAAKFAEKYHRDVALFEDIAQLAASDQVDAVYIASPNALHYQHAIQLLEAGKHVIVEKPIFSTTAELEHAHTVARDQGVFLFEAARHMQEPNFKRLQENLPRIGKLHGATLTYMKYSSRYDAVLAGEEPNIFSLRFSGGSLVDLGVYPLYTAIALFGEPESAQYFARKIVTGVDGGGPIILSYPDFHVTINQGKNSTSKLPSEIYGEKGTLWIDPLTSIETIRFLAHDGSASEELAQPIIENDMQFEAAEFARIITKKDRDSYEYLADLSLKVLRVSNELRHQNDIWFDVEKK
ncbi:Gfo/Idh/MocA family protein [Listeria ilorinensis]|uniref:Gfo/Idh/MocA family protein n=1 Tax=Listeria ilorinensis TaxID=2867439 RepID=UPI001EF41A4C|nr:Gfo/Idh/MocA family oxidoreductase [Listeria ilorinensis]